MKTLAYYELKVIRVNGLTVETVSIHQYQDLSLAQNMANFHANRDIKNGHFECDIHAVYSNGLNNPLSYRKLARITGKGV